MARSNAVERVTEGEVVLVTLGGLIDEHFPGFGDLGGARNAVLDVTAVTRMTSFGVRQWLRSIEGLPRTLEHLYLLGCPTFFVDQLNMVLNFGGAGKILTIVAPFACPMCGAESGEVIDVLSERGALALGGPALRECSRCGGRLELDESPESYFACLGKYAASNIQPAVAQLLAAHGRYISSGSATEKPPRIIKLVHGNVTYYRIIGTIGTTFRARPLLVGSEGEVVIDLAEIDRFEPGGTAQWRRLVKTLARQVSSVTLVDVPGAALELATEALAQAPTVSITSVLVRYTCGDCARVSPVSLSLARTTKLHDRTCSTCGGTARTALSIESLGPIRAASAQTATESAKLIEIRDELLSRALTDANVALAGENATVDIATNDTILGKYKIVRRLSAGGMAEVYLANQVGIGGFEKPVALKRIQRKQLESRHQAIELFLNEAKIAGRLTHPNIAQVLDVGEAAGALYIAMDYVHGRDLRKIIRRLSQTRSTLPIGTSCYIVQEVAKALDYAYMSKDMTGKRMHVVHRDVTPHNIVLGYDGMVKLVDFGVAMSAVTEHAEPMIVGKWSYMSPETTLNEPIDHRSDLFSLGVILYLLLSGEMPFSGTEPREIVRSIRAGTYERLPGRVPARLAALVDKMLAPLPIHRPQRGREVVEELAAIGQAYPDQGSPASAARLLAELLPDGEGGRTTSGPHELVRAFSGMSSSLTTIDQPPAHEVLGPALADSETSSRTVPADISETLKPMRVHEGSSLGLASTLAAGRASTEPERAMAVVALPDAAVTPSYPRRHAAAYVAQPKPTFGRPLVILVLVLALVLALAIWGARS